jgi:D-sedoheptulose 7-phosphate isomerase
MSYDLEQRARDHSQALNATIKTHADDMEILANTLAKCFANNGRVFFFGNGGSACDAMHIAGEFVGRFVDDRRALAAIALSADTGIITAVANDYNYDYIFARQIEALCQSGDMAIGLSTSGSSKNVLNALQTALEIGAYTALFTGEKGQNCPLKTNSRIIVPTSITAHIQETHLFLLHSLAAQVETLL